MLRSSSKLVLFFLFIFLFRNVANCSPGLDSLSDRGVAFYLQSDYKSAIAVFDSCVNLCIKENNKKVLANIYNNLGNCYSQKGDEVASLNYYLKSLKIAEENGDKKRMAKTIQNIGTWYSDHGDLTKALVYHRQALQLATEISDSVVIADCLNNEGIIFEQQKDYANALDVYAKALRYYRVLKDDSRLALGLNNLGIVYKYLKDYPKSIQYYTESIKYSEKSGDQFTMAANLNNLGNVYVLTGNYNKAIDLYKQSLDVAQKINASNIIYEVYEGMSEVYKLQKNYQKAYKYRLIYEEEKSKYLNEESTRQINELQAKYESEKKEAEITTLKQQEQINSLTIFRQDLKIKNRNGIIIAIFIFIAGLLLSMYLFFSRQKLKNSIAGEKAIREAEESERIRIAKDIHDELGAELSKVHFLAESMARENISTVINVNLKVISERAKLMIDNMRDLIWALTPGNMTIDGLLSRIREYSSDFLEDFNIDFNIDFPEEVPDKAIQKEAYRNIFLMVKEALNNVVKHSKATSVNLIAALSDDSFSISISDNGKGFQSTQLSAGNGLKNMKSRSIAMKASVDVVGDRKTGTIFNFSVPVEEIIAL